MISEIGSPANYLDQTAKYRSRYPYETQQMSSYATDLLNREFKGWQFWIYTKQAEVEAMFIKSPNNSLFISPLKYEASSEIQSYFANQGISIKRVLGEFESATLLANLISERSPQDLQVEVEMKTIAYVLASLNLYSRPTGAWRSVSDNDRELLLEWNSDYIREALGHEPDNVEGLVERVLLDQRTFFWIEDGKPVCMMGYSQPTPTPDGNIVRIFPVYTPFDLRGRGYAKCLVSQICMKLKNEDLGIMLFADTKNLQANEIYRKIGFIEIGFYGNLVLKDPSIGK